MPDKRRKMRVTTIRMSDAMHAQLDDAAKRQGISRSQYIREAIIARMSWEAALETVATTREADQDAVIREVIDKIRSGFRRHVAEEDPDDDTSSD